MEFEESEEDDVFGDIKDEICTALRESVRDEFSALRLDLRTILRDELANLPWTSGGGGPKHESSHSAKPVFEMFEPLPPHQSTQQDQPTRPARTDRLTHFAMNFALKRWRSPVMELRASAADVDEDEVEDYVAGPPSPPARPHHHCALAPAPPPPPHPRPPPPPPPSHPPFEPPVELPNLVTWSHQVEVITSPSAPGWGSQCEPLPLRTLTGTPSCLMSSTKENEAELASQSLLEGTVGIRDCAADVLKEVRKRRARALLYRRQLVDEEKRRRVILYFFKVAVESSYFDTLCGGFVIANAAILGIQVDWMARNASNQPPYVFRVFEIMFCCCFTVEWLMRLLAQGRRFFARGLWHWHLFDTLLVGSQLFEEAALLSVEGIASLEDNSDVADSDTKSSGSNFSWLRVLRFLRLLRVMRTVRVLRLVGELRTLVLSIGASFRPLIWSLLLLFLLMYVIGIFVTQTVFDEIMNVTKQSTMDSAVKQSLVDYFGSLGSTILSLYQAITGGANWEDLLDPLRHISIYFVPFFMLYIAFATLCVLNVITGVFVEAAMASTKQDSTTQLIERLQNLFDDTDLDGDGRVSAMEFFLASDAPEIQDVFHQLELPTDQQDMIFEVLVKSVDGDGSLSVEEFVNGCQSISSPAKIFDVKAMQMQHAQALTDIKASQTNVGFALSRLSTTLDIVVSNTRAHAAVAAPRSTGSGTEPKSSQASDAEPRRPTKSSQVLLTQRQKLARRQPLVVAKVPPVVDLDDGEEV